MNKGSLGDFPTPLLAAIAVQITTANQAINLRAVLDDSADDDHGDLTDGAVSVDYKIFVGNRVETAFQRWVR
ncbi:hypothetical protein D3C76_1776140 [compost metagenome]